MSKFLKMFNLICCFFLLAGFTQSDWDNIDQNYGDIIHQQGLLCSYHSIDNSSDLAFSQYRIYSVYNDKSLPNGLYDRFGDNNLLPLITENKEYTNTLGYTMVNNRRIFYSNFSFNTFLENYQNRNKCSTFIYFCSPVAAEDPNDLEIIQKDVDDTFSHACYRFVNDDATEEEIKPNGCNYEEAKSCKQYNKVIDSQTIYIELGIANNNKNYIMLANNSNFSPRGITVDTGGYGTITTTLSNGDALTVIDDDNGQKYFDYLNCDEKGCNYPDDVNVVYGCAGYNYHYFLFHPNSTYEKVTFGNVPNLTTGSCSPQYSDETLPEGDPSKVLLGDVEGMNFCSENGVKQVFHILGIIIFIAKLVVPLILIILGTLDLVSALKDPDDKSMKDQVTKLVKRIILAIMIFLLPTIINLVFSLIDNAIDLQGDFSGCTECVFKPFGGNCNYTRMGE